jgi:hypothetical protein
MPAMAYHLAFNEFNYVISSRAPFYHHDRASSVYQERQDYIHQSFLGLSDTLSSSYDAQLTDRRTHDLIINSKADDSIVTFLRGASVSQPQLKFGENIIPQAPLSFWKELTQCASYLRMENLFNKRQPYKIVTPKATIRIVNSDSLLPGRRPSEIKDEAESTILFSTQAMVTQVILNYFQYKIIIKVVAVTNTELFNETPTVVNCL